MPYSSYERCAAAHRSPRRRIGRGPALVLLVLLLVCPRSEARAAFTYRPFGPYGEGGEANGQTLTFGRGGYVYELAPFLGLGGNDLNGDEYGTTAQPNIDRLPRAVQWDFQAEKLTSGDLALRYTLSNQGGTPLSEVWFGIFIDADLDEDFFDSEAARMIGTRGVGPADSAPDMWEIDEPGYVFGDIWDNMLTRSLDNSNGVPASAPDDVSMALGFALGNLRPGELAQITILLSEEGRRLGPLALQQFDPFLEDPTTLTISGTAVVVPEPATWMLAIAAVAIASLGRCAQKAQRG